MGGCSAGALAADPGCRSDAGDLCQGPGAASSSTASLSPPRQAAPALLPLGTGCGASSSLAAAPVTLPVVFDLEAIRGSSGSGYQLSATASARPRVLRKLRSKSWRTLPVRSSQRSGPQYRSRPGKTFTKKWKKKLGQRARLSQGNLRRLSEEHRAADLQASSAASLTPGPTTLAELLDWPRRNCARMWQAADGELYKQRAESLLSAGLMLHSDFSGQLCAETGVMMQMRGMRLAGAKVQEQSVVPFSAVERNRQCQELILQAHRGPVHLFDDVLRHLPLDDAQRLKDMRPKAAPVQPVQPVQGLGAESEAESQQQKAARLTEAAACYREQDTYLGKNLGRLFGDHRMAPCLKHPGRHCHVTWQGLRNHPREAQPLSWEISGPMCTPHSLMGEREGAADPSMESWHVWSAAMSVSNHDLVTCENSDVMPEDMFASKMHAGTPGRWFIVPLIFCATDSSIGGNLVIFFLLHIQWNTPALHISPMRSS